MYEKNLTEDFRLRLSTKDMDFLKSLSNERSVSVSEVVRSIIGEYRRSLETMSLLTSAIQMTKDVEALTKDPEALKILQEKGGQLFNGNTETNIDN